MDADHVDNVDPEGAVVHSADQLPCRRLDVQHHRVCARCLSGDKDGVVNTYVYNASSELRIKDFPKADVDWLHCVIGHRRNAYFLDAVQELKSYDVISGKIANDNTNATAKPPDPQKGKIPSIAKK